MGARTLFGVSRQQLPVPFGQAGLICMGSAWTRLSAVSMFAPELIFHRIAMTARPALLCILDGWGWRTDPTDNAIAQARTPNYTKLLAECPHALLQTSGRAVGLPTGQMGNSEVGHMNIGAGRIVVQDLPRIDDALADHSFATRPALLELIAKTKKTKGTVHLAGLLSPGGVHSHQDHMAALV